MVSITKTQIQSIAIWQAAHAKEICLGSQYTDYWEYINPYLQFFPNLLLGVYFVVRLARLVSFHKDPVPWGGALWGVKGLHPPGLAFTENTQFKKIK